MKRVCRWVDGMRTRLFWRSEAFEGSAGSRDVRPIDLGFRPRPSRWVASCPRLLLAVLIGLAGCRPSDETESAVDPDQRSTAPPGVAIEPAELFQDVTEQAGFDFVHQMGDGQLSNIMESDGAGGAIFDYDADGWMDIYLVNSGPDRRISDAPAGTVRWPNRLFRNRGDGSFEDVTERAGVGGSGFGTTAAAADYDNDGDTDLYVVHFGGGHLFRNEGNGTFREVTSEAGVEHSGAGISATFFDADGDGHLDLFIANYLVFDPSLQLPPGSTALYPGPLAYEPEMNVLFRNRGDGSFEDISKISGIELPGHRAMSVTTFDFDQDGDSDLYVSNDATANLLLVNDGTGRFRDEGLRRGVALNAFGAAEGSMGAAIGDCDGDGLPDILVTRFGRPSLYINSLLGLFEDRAGPSRLLQPTSGLVGWGGNLFDFDNDGDRDIFIANGDPHSLRGMPGLLLENDGYALFSDVSDRGGRFFARSVNARGSGVTDFDNDGRPDLVVTTLAGRAILLRNQTPLQKHWITVRLVGIRSNHDGFGARVRVTSAGRCHLAEAHCPTRYLFQEDPRLHFGLGAAKAVDEIEIRWPSGIVQKLVDLPVDQIVTIQEPAPPDETTVVDDL